MQNKYMASCVPGAEEILRGEVIGVISGSSGITMARGKVFFSSDADRERLYGLRCADNVYLIINKFTVGPHKEEHGLHEKSDLIIFIFIKAE